MERVFVPWWILMLTAGMFIALAASAALDHHWLGVTIFSVLAAVSGWLGLVHRSRLRRLESSNTTR